MKIKMKALLLIMFVTLDLALPAQEMDKKIRKVKTVSDAYTFIKENPAAQAKVITLNSFTDSSETAKKIYEGKLHSTVAIEGHLYKTVYIESSTLLSVHYIYLDTAKLSKNQIDSVRQVIIHKYNNGTPFAELAKEYNMDGNPDSDLKWVAEDMLVTEFSSAVKEHKVGDIFTIDVTAKQWYHVALKTSEDRKVKTYSVLKIKNSN
jgi:parvulin-like peptidyl-prolyl isomerase